ncbi:MAG: YsnF/AvaK domain-containing protein [Acidobacteriaceae bacterium]
MLRDRSDLSTVIVGVFAHASDARRALNTLHEHQFPSSEVEAAFRVPALDKETVTGRETGKWFGQLRQIYRGNDRLENTPQATATGVDPEAKLASPELVLAHMGLSERDVEALHRDLDRGGAIVVVQAGARNPEAQALLERFGARIVQARTSQAQTSHSETPVSLPPRAESGPVIVTSAPFTAPRSAEPGHVQLFGEVLRVHKEKVSSGDVQVRKESVTQMETVQVPVTREQLVVEHDASGSSGAEDAIRIPLSEERVRIDKDTVLREEYKVGKREVTQTETVGDSVRRERLLIDDASARAND